MFETLPDLIMCIGSNHLGYIQIDKKISSHMVATETKSIIISSTLLSGKVLPLKQTARLRNKVDERDFNEVP